MVVVVGLALVKVAGSRALAEAAKALEFAAKVAAGAAAQESMAAMGVRAGLEMVAAPAAAASAEEEEAMALVIQGLAEEVGLAPAMAVAPMALATEAVVKVAVAMAPEALALAVAAGLVPAGAAETMAREEVVMALAMAVAVLAMAVVTVVEMARAVVELVVAVDSAPDWLVVVTVMDLGAKAQEEMELAAAVDLVPVKAVVEGRARSSWAGIIKWPCAEMSNTPATSLA